jgi:hypothetical protein
MRFLANLRKIGLKSIKNRLFVTSIVAHYQFREFGDKKRPSADPQDGMADGLFEELTKVIRPG